MPEDGAELHPATAALQALKWEDDDDTPYGKNSSRESSFSPFVDLDRALKYKDEGNKLFEFKKYRNAIIAYGEGIKQRCSDPTLNAVLFCNRAASNFYLGNYRSALRDCGLARKCKSDHIKAFVKGRVFRLLSVGRRNVEVRLGAECSMKLEKFAEALNWCNAGLKVTKTFSFVPSLRRVFHSDRRKTRETDRNARSSGSTAERKGT